jgi:hypothetical protein
VFNFHRATVTALSEVVAAAGLEHPAELKPEHFSRRVAANRVETYDTLYRFLQPGELLAGTDDVRFKDVWPLAQAASFLPIG